MLKAVHFCGQNTGVSSGRLDRGFGSSDRGIDSSVGFTVETELSMGKLPVLTVTAPKYSIFF